MTAAVRTMLVDDDPLVREHLRSILESDDRIEVVAAAADVGQALSALDAHRPAVVLLDIRMPGVDGVAGLSLLRGRDPELAVAMLTTFSDEEYVREAVAGGARGFLLKTDSPIDLVRAVPALAAGGAVFSPRVARWLVRQERADRLRAGTRAHTALQQLGRRQRRMLALVATGASNQQIAGRLHLTEGTVKQYLSTIFDELDVDNRVQAAVLAHTAGLSADADELP